MFDFIAKHLDVPQKYSATGRVRVNSLAEFFKCGQTRSVVFDTLGDLLSQ